MSIKICKYHFVNIVDINFVRKFPVRYLTKRINNIFDFSNYIQNIISIKLCKIFLFSFKIKNYVFMQEKR